MAEAGLLGLLAVTAGCADSGIQPAVPVPDESPLLVYTVSHPLAYFAGRIGGERVQVEFPAPPDVDPAFWSPSPETITGYQEADLILLNGAGYAAWIQKATLPAARIVDTSGSFSDRLLFEEDTVTHSHGPGGKHSHGKVAFTTWLDPGLAVEQARIIHDALATARPGDTPAFDAGLAALEKDLLELDRGLEVLFPAGSTPPLLGSHPVYQYLARRYGLDLRMFHLEPDEPPTEKQWRAVETAVEQTPARLMLWEGQPAPGTAKRLQSLGIDSVVFDPCGNAPSTGDFLTAMQANLRRLEQALSPPDA